MTQNINIELLETNTGQLPGLPPNPRTIRDSKFDALCKSIEDAPEMLELRELLVYPIAKGHFIVVGGNMRLEACRKLGHKEIPCKVIPADVPVAKLREYTIKDNVAFGDTDWDVLANEWDADELNAWGMEVWSQESTQFNFDESSLQQMQEGAVQRGLEAEGDCFQASFLLPMSIRTRFDKYIKEHGKDTLVDIMVAEIKNDE